MEFVDFGNTRLKVSRLAFGTGTHGWAGRSEQTDLGFDRLVALLREAYDQGVTFWDAADGYGSHRHFARALRDVPRDDVVIATKTTSRSDRSVAQDVERFLRELDTDVIDIVLLHCLSSSNWPRSHAGAMDALSRAKQEGKVRAVGVSCHSLSALRAAAETEWTDVVLARINAKGTNMSASPSEMVSVIEQAYEAGKAVYGMKVLGCGRLARDARSAIEYVLRLGIVHSLVIGISSRDQLSEDVRLVEQLASQYPLRS